MKTKENITCRDCGQVISPESATAYQSGYICQECMSSGYFICSDCGGVYPLELRNRINPEYAERYVCNNCRENYTRCAHCNDYFSSQYIWASDDDFAICGHCSSDYVFCDDCECIVARNDANYYDGEYYCAICYDYRINNDDYVKQYSYKPEPVFYGDSTESLYLGVELEIDCGEKQMEVAKSLCEHEEIYLKHDGSLSNAGFEIVTHPATLDYHTNNMNWSGIMTLCTENLFRSHYTDTCGLHIHLSRDFLGQTENEQDLNIAKIILLFDKWWDKYIVPFSRRKHSNLERWASKPDMQYEESDTEQSIVNKMKTCKNYGRYQAINLQNYNTIEFRIFRGTLNPKTFLASLQFVVTISEFAKTMRLADLYTVSWSDVFSCTEYPELKEYLKTRNLI